MLREEVGVAEVVRSVIACSIVARLLARLAAIVSKMARISASGPTMLEADSGATIEGDGGEAEGGPRR